MILYIYENRKNLDEVAIGKRFVEPIQINARVVNSNLLGPFAGYPIALKTGGDIEVSSEIGSKRTSGGISL